MGEAVREEPQHCTGGGCDASEIRSWRSLTTRPPPPPSPPLCLPLSFFLSSTSISFHCLICFFGEGGLRVFWGKLSTEVELLVHQQDKIKFSFVAEI